MFYSLLCFSLSQRDFVDVRAYELEVHMLISDFEVSSMGMLQTIEQLKNFKDRGTMEEGELETLERAHKQVSRSLDKFPMCSSIRKFLRVHDSKKYPMALENYVPILQEIRSRIECMKACHMILNKTLDRYQKFPKTVEAIRYFMRVKYLQQAAQNRVEQQWSLYQLMHDVDNSNTFYGLKSIFLNASVHLSKFLVEYFLMVRPIIVGWKQIPAVVRKVKILVGCERVDDSSILIHTYLSIVRHIKEKMMAAMDNPNWEPKKINSPLREEIEYKIPDMIFFGISQINSPLREEIEYKIPIFRA